MKVADYIVEFLAQQQIYDFFGYQGTMIAHLVDSIGKNTRVKNHSCYNEQGAAFAGCGYAKSSGKCAVVYATSGPGAINLLSGIADAYYDSVPVIFLTGQLNTYEYTSISTLRQQGFQETNIVAMSSPITKYSIQVREADDIPRVLKDAFYIANEGRKGPVLIDLPMNIQRASIILPKNAYQYPAEPVHDISRNESVYNMILNKLESAKRPVLMIGNGLARDYAFREQLLQFLELLQIPVITSLPARDLLPGDHPLNLGYIGAAYGHRYANIIVDQKADLILSLGCSLCPRQTGQRTKDFAIRAQLIRIDLDPNELLRDIHENDIKIESDARDFVRFASKKLLGISWQGKGVWLQSCQKWKVELSQFDDKCSEGRSPNKAVKALGGSLPPKTVICSDIGQHQLWIAQSFPIKKGQRLLFSGGHGAMGFALPAAIGSYYGTGMPSVCICGDGGFQMNIQELQWVVREQLPILIIILNNRSLGLIRQQQDDFFDSNYFGATEQFGYEVPDFRRIGESYGITSYTAGTGDELVAYASGWDRKKPLIIQCLVENTSKAYPKTYFGERMFNQKPYISNKLMEEILSE